MKQLPTVELLKNKAAVFEKLFNNKTWNRYGIEFLIISFFGLAGFGAVMSTTSPSWWHMLTLSWKMIVLIWGSITLCTPSLYVFSAIRGSTIKLTQLVFLLLGAMATTGIVLLSLAPITWFFIWTTESKRFIEMMTAAIIGLAILFGLYFLAKGLRSVHDRQPERLAWQKPATDILLVWLVVLLVVIVQMSQKLSPWY